MAVVPRGGPAGYRGEWAGPLERFVVDDVVPAGVDALATIVGMCWVVLLLSSSSQVMNTAVLPA